MQFEFDAPPMPPGTTALRHSVRDFLARQRADDRFSPHSNSWMTYDAAFTRACGDAGLIGMTLPAEFGGHGRTVLERYIVYEEMLAAGAPVGMHWIADRQSGPQILRHGSTEAKHSVLPRVAAGTCCIGIGMSEPDAGSDLAAVRTRGVRTAGGWKINGVKLWTSHAHRADYIIVLARTAPAVEARHAGLSQFLVDAHAPGFRSSPIRDLTGGNDFNEVQFEDVFVPDAYLLGEEGAGWSLVTQELAYERSGPDRFLSTFPLLALLVAEVASGASPSTLEALGRLVGRIATLRRMSVAIAGALDRGLSPRAEAAIVKDLGSALEREIPEIARRLVATRPDPASKNSYASSLAATMLASPSFTLRGGTREILRGIVARELGLR